MYVCILYCSYKIIDLIVQNAVSLNLWHVQVSALSLIRMEKLNRYRIRVILGKCI